MILAVEKKGVLSDTVHFPHENESLCVSLKKFIADRMRVLRKRHGLTQEQVAVLLDTDLKWYQRIEWGHKDLRLSTIERLAGLFGLNAIEFLAKDVPETKLAVRSPGAPHKPRTRKGRGTSSRGRRNA